MHCGMGRATMEWCVGSCASFDVSSVKYLRCHVIDWKPRCHSVIGSIMSVAWAHWASRIPWTDKIRSTYPTLPPGRAPTWQVSCGSFLWLKHYDGMEVLITDPGTKFGSAFRALPQHRAILPLGCYKTTPSHFTIAFENTPVLIRALSHTHCTLCWRH